MHKLVPNTKKPTPTGTAPKKPKEDNKWAWKDILPKAGEPRTKLFEGKQHHCNCPFHVDQWVCHPVEECKANPDNAGARPPSGAPAGSSGPSWPLLSSKKGKSPMRARRWTTSEKEAGE
jgi:hypothetical protein